MSQRILAEKQLVNAVEVDAVGGAKPEPEERPFIDASLMEVEKQVMHDHATGQRKEIPVVKQAVITEISSVADQLEAYGKYCQNCRYFNRPMGQQELMRIQAFGTPQEKRSIQELRVRLEMDSEEPDITTLDRVYNSMADSFISQMGLCTALTQVMGQPALMHPSQNGCPKEVPGIDGKPVELPFMYEARDAEQKKQDDAMRDMLLYKASGVLK